MGYKSHVSDMEQLRWLQAIAQGADNRPDFENKLLVSKNTAITYISRLNTAGLITPIGKVRDVADDGRIFEYTRYAITPAGKKAMELARVKWYGKDATK